MLLTFWGGGVECKIESLQILDLWRLAGMMYPQVAQAQYESLWGEFMYSCIWCTFFNISHINSILCLSHDLAVYVH